MQKGGIAIPLVAITAAIAGILIAGLVNFPIRYTSPGEKARYAFAVSADNLTDGKGNTIDIHGGGVVGMSGWIIFGGGFNLTLTGTASGLITVKTPDGQKHATNWDIAKSKYFSFTDWALLIKVKLREPIPGLPQEFYIDLVEGAPPQEGSITIGGEGLPTITTDEMTLTEIIAKGAGGVSIHGVGRSL
jgi:hypothetical protein